MMDPQDFLTIANNLRRKNKEMHWRTSIGRSYYGVFNYLIEECSKIGIKISRGPDAHSDLRNCLFNSKVDSAEDIGSKVHDLFGHRRTADYVMSDTVGGETATFVYEKARGIIQAFASIDKDSLKKGIAAYKETLRATGRSASPSGPPV